MASRSWPPPSCPGQWDSSSPALWPCPPLAVVGWGGAGDVTGTATTSIMLEKAERPQSLAGLGRSGRSTQVPQEGNPPRCPGEFSPCPAHLCCCEHGYWVPWLPEAGRAVDNPVMVLGSGTESCKEQLREHNTSTKASLSTPHLADLLSWSSGRSRLGGAGCLVVSSEGHLVRICRSGTSQSITM